MRKNFFVVNLEKANCPLWNQAVTQISIAPESEAHANPKPNIAHTTSVLEYFLPWVEMLLVVSQRGQLEESQEEYLIQLEDRSETAVTKRQNNINTSTCQNEDRKLNKTEKAFLHNVREMVHGEN